MLLRIAKGFFSSSRWLVLGVLVIIAVYLSLGRLAIFLVEANQDQVERYLRDRGLAFVEFGAIEGDWRVHDPRFIVRDISVKPLGEPVLDIDLLVLRVDSVRSLMIGVPIVTEIEVSGIRFAVERDEEKFWIRGFKRGDGSLNFDYVLDSLPYLESLKVDGINVALIGPNMEMQLVSHRDQPWVVSAEDDVKRLSFPLFLEKNQPDGTILRHELRLSGYYRGDLRESDFVSRLYLEAPQIDLEKFTPALEFAGQRLSTARLTTRIWLTLEPDNLDVTGEIELADVSLEGEGSNLLDKVTSRFRFRGESIGQGTLSIPNVRLQQGEFEFELDNLTLAIDTGPLGVSMAGQLDLVNVSELTRLIEFAGQKELLPERLSNALLSVSPGGELKDLLFSTEPGEGTPHLVSSLVDFSVEAYLGIPSIDQLNGFVSLEPDRGYLDIDNDKFEMNFKSMFDSAWSFDAGRGRIAYRVGEDSVSVTSGLIELLDGELSAYGKLSVNLPPVRDLQTWGLTIGIDDAELLAADAYIPNNLPEDLRSWIKSAIKGGQSKETGLTIHGALFRGAPAVRKAHDLYLKVEKTEIEYHPDWPSVTDLAATVHINNHHVLSNDATGKMYSSDVADVDVLVAIPSSGQADSVMVAARLSGPFEDAIRALKETPLAETTSNMAAEWSAEGEMQATLAIEVPIGTRANEEVRSDVLVSIENTLLHMPDLNLDVARLTGDISYSNERGLNSDGFTGMTFGREINGRISSQLYGEGGEIVVHVDGSVDVLDLYEWSGQILLSRASGLLDYQAEIHVPYGGFMDEIYVEAFSDLSGVIVDLPEPLSKPLKDSIHQFRYRQTFEESGFRVDLAMGEDINASLKIEDGVATGGRIHFGAGVFGAVTFDAIRMSGELPFLDFGAWETVTGEFGQISDVSLEDEIAAHVASAELSIKEFLLYYLPLDDVEMLVTRADDQWIANMRNEMFEGEVRVLDDDNAPLGVNLKWLSFESEGDGLDPLVDVNPIEVPDVDFSTGQLLLDGNDFGRWSFKYRTTEDGGRFEDLAAAALGVQIAPGGLGEWHFEDGQHSSRFAGNVLIDDVAEAQKKFGFASSIEGDGLKLRADISWDGSPSMVDIEKVSGEIEILEGSGRFVQAETGGALRLIGIFDFASLSRRFRLDFSDVIDEGFEFTDIQGAMLFEKGEVAVQEPIVIHGSSGKFTVGGHMNIISGTLDNDMIVTLPVGRTLPWYAAYSAIATGPLVGAGVMLAQKVFENQINQMSSAKYKISGTIDEPDIEFVTIFNDTVRETPPNNP
jgi:uncharacterized protein (TIGR02099 family)